MTNLTQTQPVMREPKRENSFTAPAKAEAREGISMSLNDRDRILSMIVLLLACLGLAALAHVFV